MVIGIPNAFLYHRYGVLWESFFEALGVETVTSRPSDSEILRRGTMYAIDEACLSSKLYIGHAESLIGKCDMLFVPRISNYGRKSILCTKFEALYDIVNNTFRDSDVKVLDLNIDVTRGENEMPAFYKLGKQLGKKRRQVVYAYILAKQQEHLAHAEALRAQNALLGSPGIRLLIVGHSYNVHDAMVGAPVLSFLKSQGVTPILADLADRKQALLRAQELTDTLPWLYNRELVGAVQMYREQVDGIVLISAFPCGPDSLVNEILIRRVKDKPILNLLMDAQQGTAGLETRLESFVDIIRMKQEMFGNGLY